VADEPVNIDSLGVGVAPGSHALPSSSPTKFEEHQVRTSTFDKPIFASQVEHAVSLILPVPLTTGPSQDTANGNGAHYR
jgi:hypothetical protein